MQHDVGAVDGGIHGRISAQGFDGGAHEEGHEGQLGAGGLFEFGFDVGAQRGDGGDVGFVDRIHVRETRFESTMCSAMRWRITDMGCTS